jgi:hypothetical protein
MKETFYFSHDYNARNDPKLQAVLMEMEHAGIGLFWCLIEMMYEQGGKLELNQINNYAFALRTDRETLLKLINGFNLFEIDDKYFTNASVLQRLSMRISKSDKARKSANLRWNKDHANAMRTHTKRNAIKESKGKERKGKENTSAEASSAVEVIPDLLNDTQKHIQIIGFYARVKNIAFSSLDQQRSFIKRNLRAASDLVPYHNEKIKETISYLQQKADFKWTLETVGKYIDEDLQLIERKKQTEDDIIKSIINS